MPSWADIVFAHTPQQDLRLDLRVPDTKVPPPIVMYIPMAGMRECRRDRAQWWLVEHGFAMASIECRTSSQAIAPAAVHDCKAAVRWLRSHAGEFGYRGDRIGAWGHSAGGLLSSLLATSGDVPALDEPGADRQISTQIQAACDECGAPHDLAYWASPQIQQKFPVVTENLRLYLGGFVQDRLELAKLVSPRTYLSNRTSPTLLLHGDADALVPVEETIEFYEAAKPLCDVTLRVLHGVGHGWPESLTRDDIVAFFDRTLRGGQILVVNL